MELFTSYSWPGNVRELENITHRAAIMANSDKRAIIRLSDLPEEFHKSDDLENTAQSYQTLKDQILKSLRSFNFSHSAISQTAKSLGNKDRGTITEYLRGICFQELVQQNFDIDATARVIADTHDSAILEQVKKKIVEYLSNLHPLPDISPDDSDVQQYPQFKGLPKKYHPYLLKIVHYLRENQKSS
jgi:DNA-binding NtrC family response regulator